MFATDLAACRGVDLDVFYLLGRPGAPLYERDAAAAKAVCAGCPLLDACRAYALDSGDDVAVLGGLTPAERRALRARKVAAPVAA